MRKLIARTRREDGFVMVLALVVIVVVLLLAAAIITSSVTAGNHATREYGRSAAIAAANAGLEAAVHRLSSQPEEKTVEEKQCFTNKFVEAESGSCSKKFFEEDLGNGAKYRYYVYPVMEAAPGACAGMWVEPPSGLSVLQRCVTAIGTAPDGVSARVQERVADVKGGLFPVKGVFSYTNLTFINKLKLTGNAEFGARGTVKFNNTVEKNGHTITVKYGEKVEKCPECTEIPLTPAELLVAPYAPPTQSAAPYEASRTSNNNAAIKFTPASEGEITTNREFNANSPEKIVIPSGTYNFCSIFIKNVTTIEYTPPVTMYIDSPNRTGSPGCTAENGYAKNENGTVEFVNKVTWKDLAASPKASDLVAYAWGKPPETAAKKAPIFQFTNTVGGPMYATIYAPYSYVHLTNQGNIVGAIVGGTVEFTNSVEFTGELGEGFVPQTGATFYAVAYHQCAPSYKEAEPGVGCY